MNEQIGPWSACKQDPALRFISQLKPKNKWPMMKNEAEEKFYTYIIILYPFHIILRYILYLLSI